MRMGQGAKPFANGNKYDIPHPLGLTVGTSVTSVFSLK